MASVGDLESGQVDIQLTRSQKLATINEGSSLLGPEVEHRSFSSHRGGVTESIRKLRSHTMTVSLLEKPSHDRRASAFMAGWNVSNLIQGTGILGVPYAVSMGGWAGVIAILVIAWVCCFTGKLLVDCLYEDSKRTGQRKRVRTNYPEVGEAVLPGFGHKIVSIVQVCEMFGGIIMYIVLLATVFNDMLKAYTELNIYHWAVICTYVAFPGIFIKRVSIIAWISMFSVFSLMVGLATLIIYCITEYDKMDIHNIPVFNAETFPIGFGIIVFSYCAHAVFPGVEGSMKEPKKFPAMMNFSFLLAAVIKCLLGLMAVLRFGTHTEQVITVSIKSHAFNYLSNALVITNVFLAFPICFFIVLETWDTNFLPFFPHLQPDSSCHWFWLLITRLLLATLALFLGIVVPHFGLLMGFVGSFTGTCLSFVFPCVFHMKLKWKKLKWYNIALRCFVIVFGLVCGGFGLVFSARDLAKSFNSQGF
ncbi:vesicular inhibitory amino acid transporter-like [Exaiptasia diaphana]|uniref:Amino acid transporter transmembrane domain-containing protein n=1 Tax=Exaiptasia diaphana TaxID=2652724 RepID=A0A913Y8S9_EXADI|nr:vesicular inhibitory amino acid transporter-like [Exaiptasia diaphana]